MKPELAPIGLSTYSRLSHLQKAIEALQKNSLAEKSELYVFSDGPKSGDEDKVNSIRQYLRTIDGFRSITIIEREQNDRVTNNRSGMRMLLDKYGQLIFLEEDVAVAPQFLSYMNWALEKYKDDKRVFSITGYCPPIQLPDDYLQGAFFLRRFNAWGFGIWKDRFEKIDYVSRGSYFGLIQSIANIRSFANNGGEDMLGMLRLDSEGVIDALDVKAMYAQFINDQYTLYPKRSLTINIGMDGSGVHCRENSKFDVDRWDDVEDFKLPEFGIDQRIVDSHNKFRQPRLRVRWSERIKILLARYFRNKLA